jgi:hypothetical protein
VGTLELFAELFVGFAGFSGIVLALSATRNWGELDRVRVRILITNSLAGIFASVVPLIFVDIISEHLLWKFMSGLLSIYFFTIFGWVFFAFRRIDFINQSDASPFFGIVAIVLGWPIIIFLPLSAAGIAVDASITSYLVALLFVLFLSAGMFFLLLGLVLKEREGT